MASAHSSPVLLSGVSSKIPVAVSAHSSPVRASFSRSSIKSSGFSLNGGWQSADDSPHHPHYHNHSRSHYRAGLSAVSAPLVDHQSVPNTPMHNQNNGGYNSDTRGSLNSHQLSNTASYHSTHNFISQPTSDDCRFQTLSNNESPVKCQHSVSMTESSQPSRAMNKTSVSNAGHSSLLAPQGAKVTRTGTYTKYTNSPRSRSNMKNSGSLHSCSQPTKPSTLSLSGCSLQEANNVSPASGPAKFEAFIMTGEVILSLATRDSQTRNLVQRPPRAFRRPAGSELNCSQLMKQCLTMDDGQGSLSMPTSPAGVQTADVCHEPPNSTGSSAEHSAPSTPDEERLLCDDTYEPASRPESGGASSSCSTYGDCSLPSSGSGGGAVDEHRPIAAPLTESSMSEGYSILAAQMTSHLPHSSTLSMHSYSSEAESGTRFGCLDPTTTTALSPPQETCTVNENIYNMSTTSACIPNMCTPSTCGSDNMHINSYTTSSFTSTTKSNHMNMVNTHDPPTTLSQNKSSDLSYNELDPLTNTRRYPSFIVAEQGTIPMTSIHPPATEELEHHKTVDAAAASRLAKRLYLLDGFRKSDVSRHLSKNNEFAREVASAYVSHFEFNGLGLLDALRLFLVKFSLTGETQERERVLMHFARRYLFCNEDTFGSADAVHTLTCAIMLLNTDLHGENVGRKMLMSEFIENLSGLNDGRNFPMELLQEIYQSIKSQPLQWSFDDEDTENMSGTTKYEIPSLASSAEFKTGFLLRKCCIDTNGKRTPMGKRSWRKFFVTLRDLVLHLHKDEKGSRKNQVYETLQNAIRIHHCFASVASDYSKKHHVFRLRTANQAEYLFQASDEHEMQQWIDTINFVSGCLSAPPLPSSVTSIKGTPKRSISKCVLPVNVTKLTFVEQLNSHQDRLAQLKKELGEAGSRRTLKPLSKKSLKEFVETEYYIQLEIERYSAYVKLMQEKVPSSAHLLAVAKMTPVRNRPLSSVAIGEEANEDGDFQNICE